MHVTAHGTSTGVGVGSVPMPRTQFPNAPEGWSVQQSNAKNDLVHGYVGRVLISPTGDTFIGSNGAWSLLDDMYRALLASAAR